MQLNGVRSALSYKKEKAVRQNLLKKFLSHAYAEPKGRNLSWLVTVKRDIKTLCETSAIFDLNAQLKEYPLVPAPGLQKQWNKMRPNILISRSQVMRWMAQLQDALEHMYPRQFPTPEPVMVNEWRIPATLQGIILHCRVGERRRTIALKTKKIIKRKVFVFIKHSYIVDWPDIFWFAIAELLEEFASALRRCLECGKLFLKSKRQQHCSSGCRITLWRRENPDRTYEIRRKAYVSAVHDRLPGVKVQRRGPRLLKHPTGG